MWKRDQQAQPTPDVRQPPVKPPIPAVQPSAPVVTSPPPLETPAKPAVAPIAPKPGSSLLIKGDISASEDLELYGRVEGNVSLPGHVLTIGPKAELQGQIVTRALIVQGLVTGNVAATERFEIRPGGRMKGDVTSPNVVMSEGSEFTGRVDMRRNFASPDGPPTEGERRRDR